MRKREEGGGRKEKGEGRGGEEVEEEKGEEEEQEEKGEEEAGRRHMSTRLLFCTCSFNMRIAIARSIVGDFTTLLLLLLCYVVRRGQGKWAS